MSCYNNYESEIANTLFARIVIPLLDVISGFCIMFSTIIYALTISIVIDGLTSLSAAVGLAVLLLYGIAFLVVGLVFAGILFNDNIGFIFGKSRSVRIAAFISGLIFAYVVLLA